MIFMKLATFFARDEIRSYQDSLAALESEIERLRQNGIAQAKDLGGEINALQIALNEADAKANGLGMQLAEAHKSLESSKASERTLLETIDTQAKAHEQRLHALEGKLKEATEESELLLLQLHQVQEELETVFLNEQAAAQAVREKDSELDALRKQVEALLAAEKRLSEEKSVLTAARDQEKTNAQNERSKADAVIASLNQQKQELATSLEGTARELRDTLTQRDEQAKLAGARQQELERLKTELEGQVREAQEENELLLLQLHQVQEELEHYFLEHQKVQRENDSQVKRWQRLEARFPNYLDCESVIPVAVDAFSDEPKVDWRVRDVTVAGAVLPELSFTTFLRDGQAGIALKSGFEGTDAELSLVPRALTKPQAVAEVMRFRNFRTSEWRLFLVAASAIEQFFSQGKVSALNLPEDFDLAFWRQSVLPVVADIRALPPVLRFERAQLKRELIHSDYEHLWLQLHDVSFGTHYRWPKFELRLGASSIIPGSFSRQPKLELPRIDGKTAPFPSWFEESYDDFGGKFELRFELTRKIFDVGVWGKLNAADQSLVLSLIGSLPLILDRMQAEKVAIARPWQDWRNLANGMAEVLQVRFSEARARAQQVPAGTRQEKAALSSEANAQPASIATKSPSLVSAVATESRASASEAGADDATETIATVEEASVGVRHPNRNKRSKRRKA